MTVAAIAADARLDPFASQRAFRALLDALSRPGRPTAVEPPDGIPAALVPALALADVDVTVCVLAAPDAHDWGAIVAIATGARTVELEHADVVVALRPPTPDEVRSLQRGRADAPEEGARLALACEAIGHGAVRLKLRGPGVPDRRTVDVDGVPAEVFDALVSVNRRFPTGVDTFLLATDGTVVGIPPELDDGGLLVGYAAVKGGLDAIRAAEALVRRKRFDGDSAPLGADQVVERMRLAVDRVQGEGGLWAPELAAIAIRQAEGDLIEASQLVRSYRSTCARLAYSEPTSVDEIRVLRRIVPAYRTPPGPQLLGRTLDYTGRLLDFDDQPGDEQPTAVAHDDERGGPRLLEVLRAQDLLVERRVGADPEPFDITRRPLTTPAPRSARLATMARGETGALVNLWYQNVRGPKSHLHDVTLGEVRHGRLPVRLAHPVTGDAVEIGEVEVTEVEAIEDVHSHDDDRLRFDVGYGLCLGHNERKAIAMAMLDIAIERADDPTFEQSVLQTCDGLDANGFLEHFKLPHYVTFRSMVDRKLAVRAKQTEAISV